MGICAAIRSLGSSAARGVLGTADGRQLAQVLGLSSDEMMRAVLSGGLDSMCAAANGASGPAARLEQMVREALSESQSQGSASMDGGFTYENCKVIRDADGNLRVICPEQGPGGACGCGNCPPNTTTTGNTNCLGQDPSFAPCTVDNVCKAYEMAPFSTSITVAAAVAGEPTKLFQRVSATRFVLTILPVGVAAKLCLDSIAVTLNGTSVIPSGVGFNLARLRRDPSGTWVWAWDVPRFAWAANFVVTDGRCACPPNMCGCQVYNGPSRVAIELVSAPSVGDVITLAVNTHRENCGQAQCGPCPPGDLCGATLLLPTYLNAAAAAISPQSYLWGGGLPPQEPTLNYPGPF